MNSESTSKALVVGVGPLGRRVAHELSQRGIAVTGASRNRPSRFSGDWQPLDATDATAVRTVATDADLVFLCAAPPLARWGDDFQPLVAGVLDGLKGSNKVLVSASNLYPYGPQDAAYTEESPELATDSKGRLRAELDEHVLSSNGNGLTTAVVRGSSFYGPEVEMSMLGEAELQALKDGGRINALGSVDQPHTMTYIDDFARTMVSVALAADAGGQIWHTPMQPATTWRELATTFGDRLGTTPTFRIASPTILTVMGWFNPTMRALKDTLYTYTAPYIADGSKYCTTFDDAPTPFDETVEATLQGAGFGGPGKPSTVAD